jgi:GTP-dependent phosphoenolpyruvate carboxykinase
LSVDTDAWRDELPQIGAHYDRIGERLPSMLADQLDALAKRLTD